MIGRLKLAAHTPIDVAQMVIDCRIARFDIGCPFKLFQCFIETPEAIIGPAERIDDVAGAWSQLHRLADHFQTLIEVHVHVDP